MPTKLEEAKTQNELPHVVPADGELSVFCDTVNVHCDAGFAIFTFFQTVPTPTGDKPLKKIAVARVVMPEKLVGSIVQALNSKFGMKDNG